MRNFLVMSCLGIVVNVGSLKPPRMASFFTCSQVMLIKGKNGRRSVKLWAFKWWPSTSSTTRISMMKECGAMFSILPSLARSRSLWEVRLAELLAGSGINALVQYLSVAVDIFDGDCLTSLLQIEILLMVTRPWSSKCWASMMLPWSTPKEMWVFWWNTPRIPKCTWMPTNIQLMIIPQFGNGLRSKPLPSFTKWALLLLTKGLQATLERSRHDFSPISMEWRSWMTWGLLVSLRLCPLSWVLVFRSQAPGPRGVLVWLQPSKWPSSPSWMKAWFQVKNGWLYVIGVNIANRVMCHTGVTAAFVFKKWELMRHTDGSNMEDMPSSTFLWTSLALFTMVGTMVPKLKPGMPW